MCDECWQKDWIRELDYTADNHEIRIGYLEKVIEDLKHLLTNDTKIGVNNDNMSIL